MFIIKSFDEITSLLAALDNPHRLKIIALLQGERLHVSGIARRMGISRPLVHMHLKRLETAGLVKGSLELSADGKAMKYYEVVPFSYELTPGLIRAAAIGNDNRNKEKK